MLVMDPDGPFHKPYDKRYIYNQLFFLISENTSRIFIPVPYNPINGSAIINCSCNSKEASRPSLTPVDMWTKKLTLQFLPVHKTRRTCLSVNDCSGLFKK